MTAEERAALAAIDPEIVRMRFAQFGGGPRASIPGFDVQGGCITRSDLEDWLIEENKKAAGLERSHYRKILGWTVAGVAVAFAAAVAAAISAWPVIEPWIRSTVLHSVR